MKGAKPQTQTTTVDPGTQNYIQQIRQRALSMSGTPTFNPTLTGATDLLGGYANAGLTGMNALTDPAAAARFMNPYTAAMDPVFNFLRQQAQTSANQQATAAGAFGGSRADVLAGTQLADINRQQAGFNYQGFNDAQQRALQAANLGMGATGTMAGIGQFLSQLPIQQQQLVLQALGLGMTPTTTTATVPAQKNTGAGVLGGALTGAQIGSMIPGVGTGIGAIGGGLLGLFG